MRRDQIEEKFLQAVASSEKWRTTAAFRLFLEAAQAGHLDAQVSLGYLFDVGVGTRKSRPKALYWYRRAARRGDAAAASNIGTIFRDDGRPRLALRWFEKAAARGDDDALLEIAKLYAGPLADISKAKRTLRRVLASNRTTQDTREQALRLLHELTPAEIAGRANEYLKSS